MTSILARTGVALAIAGLAAFTPTVAQADVSVQETQAFTGSSYEQSSGKAKREAEAQARRYALLSGFNNDQCVLLYSYSDGAGFGWWYGYAGIRCTR
ncbi:hypothetical protein ACH4E8_15005 [Streptomyces sp. NPDC017979]|uniref:hypothetical protein n=1 Tax=unclassified Streptomyces TaxID=2593676 RepID=UPI0037AEC85A